ncbi:MAG: ribose-phosphate diphosphokinase [Bacilli bacterium]
MENNNTLGLIILDNIKDFGKKVTDNLNVIRRDTVDYQIPIIETRFNNGEGKLKITRSVRDKDIFILTDVGNYSCTYKMFDFINHFGPDEHFQDTKRVIEAIKGQANSITLVMPLLYNSRQHKRKGRESLDCAVALRELEAMGIKNIITFDAHDPNVQNAIPLCSFENVFPTVSILKYFIAHEEIDYTNTLIISPDTGAMDRTLYYADMLKCNVGIFSKRRDLTKIVNGKNPIVAHEYIGKDINNEVTIVVDDMIASGDSILDVAKELKKRGASKVYLIATYSLFTMGYQKFDEAYQNGLFDKIYTTNLSYIPQEIANKPWISIVDCSYFLANIINNINNHQSISQLLNGKEEIIEAVKQKVLTRY